MLRRFTRRSLGALGVMPSTGAKHVAIPINSTNRPRPVIKTSLRTGRLYRDVYLRTASDDLKHLQGVRPYFLECDASKPYALYALDIDAPPQTPYEYSRDVGRRLLAEVFDGLVPLAAEPSRSSKNGRGGCYLWVVIHWGNTPPQLRCAAETAVNVRLRSALSQNHTAVFAFNISTDGFRGTGSWVEPNPCYEELRAQSPSMRKCMKIELVEGLLISKSEFHKFKQAITQNMFSEIPGLPGHFTADALPNTVITGLQLDSLHIKLVDSEEADFPERLVELTQGEEYERAKAFYGIPIGAQTEPWTNNRPNPWAEFTDYDVGLEEYTTHRGNTITAPCFACLSGDRPNNLAAFRDALAIALAKKAKPGHGRLDGRKLLEIMEQQQTIRACSRTSSVSELGHDDHDHDSEVHTVDDDALEGSDCFAAMGAAARKGLRECNGETEAACDVAYDIYMRTGLATGDTWAEEKRRRDTIRRCVAYAERTYDPSARGTGQASRRTNRVAKQISQQAEAPAAEGKRLWFLDPQDMTGMQKRLAHAFTRTELEHYRLNTKQVAAVACWLMKNIVFEKTGEVPVTSIEKGVRYLGIPINRSKIAIIMRRLTVHKDRGVVGQAGPYKIAVLVRDYSAPMKGCGPGRCRTYLLNPNFRAPAWLKPYVAASHYYSDYPNQHITKTRPDPQEGVGNGTHTFFSSITNGVYLSQPAVMVAFQTPAQPLCYAANPPFLTSCDANVPYWRSRA
jgi:hypothetical protein